ncbi:MAG: response regulator transcription factor [Chloroflexota bacterium]
MANQIKLLLVDDEPAVRRGLRMRLELEPDVQIVGEAVNGSQAVQMAEAMHDGVVVMDIEMPVMNGIDATSEITSRLPGVAIVVLSMHDDAATIGRARKAGAAAFIAKRSMDDSLIEAIRSAARGQGGASDDSDSN